MNQYLYDSNQLHFGLQFFLKLSIRSHFRSYCHLTISLWSMSFHSSFLLIWKWVAFWLDELKIACFPDDKILLGRIDLRNASANNSTTVHSATFTGNATNWNIKKFLKSLNVSCFDDDDILVEQKWLCAKNKFLSQSTNFSICVMRWIESNWIFSKENQLK